MLDTLGVYIHIPYCRTLCPYCDFVKTRTKGQVPSEFVDALVTEIAAYTGPRRAGSIFFGGGTPSLLAPGDLERILKRLGQAFDLEAPEITLEANPDDMSPELLQDWRDLGVNRVSLGVQSFDDGVLRYLGRRHDSRSARRACDWVAAAFPNWSLDLIFGARSRQNPDDATMLRAWEATLHETQALAPPHCSAYGLTYEAGTPFARRASEAVDDDTYLELFQMAEAALADYDHYEISNYARPGRQALHNLIYWHNGQYAGFGTGAYAYLDGVRARNHADLGAYLAAPGAKEEALRLGVDEIKVETLIQYFRLREGLPRSAYEMRFGAPVEADFDTPLRALCERGLLESTETHLRPTCCGFQLNNEIALALL